MATVLGYPGPLNVFVPNMEASGGLLFGFSRNAKSFPVNNYIQIFPSKQMVGVYASYTSRNAARIISDSDNEHVWADGNAAPTGTDNLESFAWKTYTTTRRAYAYTIGELTVDQAEWDIILVTSNDMAQQCMTARTMLVHAALSGETWGSNTAAVDGGILSSGQNWTTGNDGSGSNQGPNIKKSIQYGQKTVNLYTIGVVRPKDLTLVVNPTTAQAMAASTEIQDYLKQSPFALAQIRGDAESQNGIWGLPDMLYSVNVMVEDAVRVTSRKGAASDSLSYVMPDGVAYLLARQGKLVGLAGSRSYSTVQLFFYKDEMTVETMYDQPNKRYMGRVISNYVVKVATVFSGFRYTACLT